MARRKQDSRFEWSREARRVQPLVNGVRIFDHEGNSHTISNRPESSEKVTALIEQIAENDADCAQRVTAELAAMGDRLTFTYG